MKFSGSHFKRYRQIAQLLWKYGRGDLVQQMGGDFAIDSPPAPADGGNEPNPEQLADDLEAMGPTYVKLGQVLSGRADLLPAPYLKALARLQDKVKPFSYEEVEKMVTAELGIRISKAFSSFESEPIAAASLGQVHCAALRDGRPVVVKVQRPDIRKQVEEDFEVLTQIATFLDEHTAIGRRYRFSSILDEFRSSIHNELDYEREAHNLVTLRENLKDFERIRVPQPIRGYCTRCVLTMERVRGHKVTSLSPVAMLDVDGSALAEELFKAYLKQVLVDGFFHADPHPGNVLLTEHGRIALLDLGMVGHTTPAMQESLLKLLLLITEGKSEQAADLVIHMSKKAETFDADEFRRSTGQLLARQQDQLLKDLNVGRSLLELSSSAGQNGLFVPSELTLLGKTLLQLDEIGTILDPHFDPNDSIRRNVAQLISKRMRKATQADFFTSILDAKEFVQALPSLLNRTLSAIAGAELEVKVRALDARTVVEGIEKIANRITMGLILAALIVGAALLMRVETRFRLWGYPGFAMVCFLIAVAGGVWLVFSALIQDHRRKK